MQHLLVSNYLLYKLKINPCRASVFVLNNFPRCKKRCSHTLHSRTTDISHKHKPPLLMSHETPSLLPLHSGSINIYPKRDENGEWGRLHNEDLHNLYRSPNIVKVIKSRRLWWAGHVAWMEEGRRAFKMLTGKPTEKRSLGMPRGRWEDNIKMVLKEIGINTMNWVDSALNWDYWRALVNFGIHVDTKWRIFIKFNKIIKLCAQSLYWYSTNLL